MEKQVKPLYKKGNIYNYVDNTNYLCTKEYEPETIIKRELNPITEQYEYIEETINHKLDWENQEQMLTQIKLIDKELNK